MNGFAAGPDAAPAPVSLRSLDQDRGAGNLVAVQTCLTPADYATPARFRARLAGYLATAADAGWLNPKTIVVLPEHLGTWLVAVDEPAAVLGAVTTTAAMGRLVLRHPLAFLRAYLAARAPDRVAAAVFRLKARRMAAVFDATCGDLARQYGVTLVAGSMVLPTPGVVSGRLQPGRGALQNVAVVYGPDGRARSPLTRKRHPTAAELPFTAPSQAPLPVLATPAGRLGVVICADSWYPDSYEQLRAGGAEIVAVPNNLGPAGVWQAPWGGYDPGPAPADADPGDAGRLREGEAWLKYALAGRLAASGARLGLHVYFRGQMWDLGHDGHTIVVGPDGVYEAPDVDGPALLNVWLAPAAGAGNGSAAPAGRAQGRSSGEPPPDFA